MKLIFHLKRVFSILIVLLPFTGLAQDFTFRGVQYEDKVAFFWLPDVWPEDLRGVIIRKRQEGETDWRDLSGSAVIPSSEEDKNLDNVAFGSQIDSVRVVYEQFVDNGSIQYTDDMQASLNLQN